MGCDLKTSRAFKLKALHPPPHPAVQQVVSLPSSLLLGGSGPSGAKLTIAKAVDLGKAINDVAFCGNWLALALNGAAKVRPACSRVWC